VRWMGVIVRAERQRARRGSWPPPSRVEASICFIFETKEAEEWRVWLLRAYIVSLGKGL
jgi:hypothetical protein